jgi:hypothetical protein
MGHPVGLHWSADERGLDGCGWAGRTASLARLTEVIVIDALDLAVSKPTKSQMRTLTPRHRMQLDGVSDLSFCGQCTVWMQESSGTCGHSDGCVLPNSRRIAIHVGAADSRLSVVTAVLFL